MKRIFESEFVGFDESASRLVIWSFEDEDEYLYWEEMDHDQRCHELGTFDERGCDVRPGGLYYYYSFDIRQDFMIVTETKAYNV